MGRLLVAGIGNIFLGDDGFGVEVVRRLRGHPIEADVDVADFGIRAIHLAYALSDGTYDAAILVDAVARGGAPGTLYAIEVDPGASDVPAEAADAHTLTPDTVLAFLKRLDAPLSRILIVGCEPAAIDESMELSAPVAASVDGAIDMIRGLVEQMTTPCV
jgi:hydrogenase maturation protease